MLVVNLHLGLLQAATAAALQRGVAATPSNKGELANKYMCNARYAHRTTPLDEIPFVLCTCLLQARSALPATQPPPQLASRLAVKPLLRARAACGSTEGSVNKVIFSCEKLPCCASRHTANDQHCHWSSSNCLMSWCNGMHLWTRCLM